MSVYLNLLSLKLDSGFSSKHSFFWIMFWWYHIPQPLSFPGFFSHVFTWFSHLFNKYLLHSHAVSQDTGYSGWGSEHCHVLKTLRCSRLLFAYSLPSVHASMTISVSLCLVSSFSSLLSHSDRDPPPSCLVHSNPLLTVFSKTQSIHNPVPNIWPVPVVLNPSRASRSIGNFTWLFVCNTYVQEAPGK